jgi:hypothetical protein
MVRLVTLVLVALLVGCSSGPTATSGDRLACENVKKANQVLQQEDVGAYLSMATAARLADDHHLVQAGQILQESANAVLHNNDLERSSMLVAAARIEEICRSLGVATKATP